MPTRPAPARAARSARTATARAPAAPAAGPGRATPADIARPLVSIDVAIFTVLDERLQVLLIERGGRGDPHFGQWALPGGLVDVAHDADLEHCALRKLRDKTGVDSPYLEQVVTCGNATRDPRGWSVTTVYFALLRQDLVLRAGTNSSDARWFDVDALPRVLAFDHATLLERALERLRSKVEYSALPVHLMPERFTLPELQRAFEIVLGRPLDKSAFRTRMTNAGVLEEVSAVSRDTRRPAQLWRVKSGAVLTLDWTFRKR